MGEQNYPRETKTSGANEGRNWRTQICIKQLQDEKSTFHEAEAQRQSGTALSTTAREQRR